MQSNQRRILFICPKFFDYHSAIKAGLEKEGFVVDWYDDRPASTPLIKALIRFRPELVAPMSDAYFDKILEETKGNNYEFVLVIKGEALSVERLKKFGEQHRAARFIYYTWDSLRNFKNGTKKLELFEKVFSFDRFDCQTIATARHLPLFYGPHYEVLAQSTGSEQDIDCLFLGSIHSDRYSVVKGVRDAVKAALPSVKTHCHFFYQSRRVFLLRKIFDIHFRGVPWAEVNWFSLNAKEALSLISRSNILIDVHHPGQTGLTMRTIECLGARKKLITTNSDIVNYDFYTPKNILVVDRKKPVIDPDFIKGEYQTLDEEIYEKYSLRAWLRELVS